jgi:hypothetical protein
MMMVGQRGLFEWTKLFVDRLEMEEERRKVL